jgi:GNAT superfamily N-acetyltransferase
MRIQDQEINVKGIKFYVMEGDKEVGRTYLYILKNDLHDQPFGFMEDVFVDETQRGKGIGSELVKKVIEEARNKGCYKLICTSRYSNEKVHELYKRFGFKDHGMEFRMNLEN